MAFLSPRAGLLLTLCMFACSSWANPPIKAQSKHAASHTNLKQAVKKIPNKPPNKAASNNSTKSNSVSNISNTKPKANPRNAFCQRLVPRLPGVRVNDCNQPTLQVSHARSNNGFPFLLKEQVGPKGKNPIRVLLLGGIHGDELTASAIVFQWMRSLQTPAAQNFHWKIAPLVNPDGLLSAKPKRVNANGVDLNRNFPTPNWRAEADRYWNKQTGNDPRRFPGKRPLSEPESRWINEQIEHFKPDVIVSVHAPFGVLDFDGPAPAPQKFGRLMFTPVGVYPGSLGNYIGMQKNLPIITIELPNAQSMPPDAEVQRIWQDMLAWIHGHVFPRNTNKLLAANTNNRPNTKSHAGQSKRVSGISHSTAKPATTKRTNTKPVSHTK